MWRLPESTHSFTRTLKKAVPTKFRTLGQQPAVGELAANLHEQIGDEADRAVRDAIDYSKAAVESVPQNAHNNLAKAKDAYGTLKMIKLSGQVSPQHREAFKNAMRQAEKQLDYSRLAIKKEAAFDKLLQKAWKPGSIVSSGRFETVKALLPEKVSEAKLQKSLGKLMKGLPSEENEPTGRNGVRAITVSKLIEKNGKVTKIKADLQHLRKTGGSENSIWSRIEKNIDKLSDEEGNKPYLSPKLLGQYAATVAHTHFVEENRSGIRNQSRRYELKDSSNLRESHLQTDAARTQIHGLKEKLQGLEAESREIASKNLSKRDSSVQLASARGKYHELLHAAKRNRLPQDPADRRVYQAERDDIVALAKARMEGLEKIQKSEASLQKLMNTSAQRGHLRTETPSYPSRLLHKALAKTGLTSSYSEAELQEKINKLEQRYAGIMGVRAGEAMAGRVPQHLNAHYRPSLATLVNLRDSKSEIKTALKRVANAGLGSIKNINGMSYDAKLASLETLHTEYKGTSFMPSDTKATLNQHLSKYAVNAQKSITRSVENSLPTLKPWKDQRLLTNANFYDKSARMDMPAPLQLIASRISDLRTLNSDEADRLKGLALKALGERVASTGGGRPGSAAPLGRTRPVFPEPLDAPGGSRPGAPTTQDATTGSRPGSAPATQSAPTASRPGSPPATQSAPGGSRPASPTTQDSPTASRPGSPPATQGAPGGSRPGSPTTQDAPTGSRPGSPPATQGAPGGSRPGSPTTQDAPTGSRPGSAPATQGAPGGSRPGSPTDTGCARRVVVLVLLRRHRVPRGVVDLVRRRHRMRRRLVVLVLLRRHRVPRGVVDLVRRRHRMRRRVAVRVLLRRHRVPGGGVVLVPRRHRMGRRVLVLVLLRRHRVPGGGVVLVPPRLGIPRIKRPDSMEIRLRLILDLRPTQGVRLR